MDQPTSDELKGFKRAAYPGVLHHYSPKLTAFEHTPASPSPSSHKPHAILFIGGMGDGLLTVPFIPPLAVALAPTSWSLFSLLLSSSYSGWGTRSLADDCKEIAKCIRHVRAHKQVDGGDGKSKIVLMGHSTGSQDVLHYLINVADPSPVADGAILQAPVSDREGLDIDGADEETKKAFADAQDHASEIREAGLYPGSKALMPIELTQPFYGKTVVSVVRWLSLHAGEYEPGFFDDDLFSSDVGEERLLRTFGAVRKKVQLCVLHSGADEHVPERVDKKKLLAGWSRVIAKNAKGKAVWDGENSGIIEGARHALDGDGQEAQRRELIRRVTGFLKKVESDSEVAEQKL